MKDVLHHDHSTGYRSVVTRFLILCKLNHPDNIIYIKLKGKLLTSLIGARGFPA